MIRITDTIWIGSSLDERFHVENQVTDCVAKIGSVLNVANDLRGCSGWPEVEYAQVGLIDGPGNPLSAYYAAVLTLASLQRRHATMVCCHSGSRSVAVVVMYLNAMFTIGYEKWMNMIRERISCDLPVPDDIHVEAFDKINWKVLTKLIGDVR